nr:MAG: hypothetical protein [Botourmiaviridae sp.]
MSVLHCSRSVARSRVKSFRQQNVPRRGVSEETGSPGTHLLGEVASVLGSIFSVELGVPNHVIQEPAKEGKKFCVGLLENPVNHTWWPAVGRLGKRERFSVSGSLFLARKVLPSSPDPLQASKHATLMSSQDPSTSPDYLLFVQREIDRMFEIGWDRGYKSHVYSHTPTSSSCLQYSRKKGGAKRWIAEQGQDWFADSCLGETSLPTRYRVRYAVVRTAGKDRGVTVPDGHAGLLGPLHRTLYDYLSQFGWLLRGEARGKKFRSFSKRKGEVFVSGDYESATDNLSLTMTEYILARVLSRARHIPSSLAEYALRSCRAEIEYRDLGGRVVNQTRGQLMGNFLSFPLLCLHNYLTFRFSIPRDVPVRINGDDIVFRCHPSEFETWKKNVGVAGLVLSAGKTLVHDSCFSLNSAFFCAESNGVREIPVIRSSWLESRDGPPTGADFGRFIRNWNGEARRLVGALWLRCHKRRIQATGRSVGCLGIRADNSQLHTAGLAPREAFFRGANSLVAVPETEVPPTKRNRQGLPGETWVFTRKAISSKPRERFSWDHQYRDACRASAWNAEVSREEIYWSEWWREAAATGREYQWLAWRRTVKRVHKMARSLNLRLRALPFVAPVKGQWIPRDELPVRLCRRQGVGFR